MTGFVSGKADAERAAQLIHDLHILLRGALTEQDDGALVVDLSAWREAGVPEALRSLRNFIGPALKRLNE